MPPWRWATEGSKQFAPHPLGSQPTGKGAKRTVMASFFVVPPFADTHTVTHAIERVGGDEPVAPVAGSGSRNKSNPKEPQCLPGADRVRNEAMDTREALHARCWQDDRSFQTFDALRRLALQPWRCPPEEVPLGQCRPRPTAQMEARGSLA